MPTNSKEYMRKYAKDNYKKYWGTPEAIKKRASRNKANKMKNPWPWKEVDHKDWNPLNNAPSNLRVISQKLNRKLGGQKSQRNRKK